MKVWWCGSEEAARKGGCVLFRDEVAGLGRHQGCGWKRLTSVDALVIEKEEDGRWPTWAIRTLYSIRDPQSSFPVAVLDLLASQTGESE